VGLLEVRVYALRHVCSALPLCLLRSWPWLRDEYDKTGRTASLVGVEASAASGLNMGTFGGHSMHTTSCMHLSVVGLPRNTTPRRQICCAASRPGTTYVAAHGVST
jgi:hypothetical protein